MPHLYLLVNKVPQAYAESDVRQRVEQAYRAEVIAVIPHSEELMALASAGVFALRYPEHPISARLRQVAHRLAT